MAGQKGRDVLLKIADDAGVFITVAGIRTKSIQLNAAPVDGTSADSPEAWRELIAGAGLRTVRVVGSGVFKDAASDFRMKTLFFSGSISDWQLIVPDFGALLGPFQITELTFSGDHNGEAQFSLTIESAGLITFEEI